MNCTWYQRWLMASADDELGGWRLALLRSHLSSCKQCTDELAQLQRLRKLVAGQKAQYTAKLDPQLFLQRLRANLKPAVEAPTSAEGLVMAYSYRPKNLKPTIPDEPVGLTFFGNVSSHRLAWSAVGVAVLAAVLIGIRLASTPSGNPEEARVIPLLPEPGIGKVEINDLQPMQGISASVVHQPDADLTVIWVNGLPKLQKESAPASNNQ